MNTHQLLRLIENDMTFLNLLKRGIVPISVLDKKVYYERYLLELKTTKTKIQAINNTAEEFKVGESTVKRAIYFMEK